MRSRKWIRLVLVVASAGTIAAVWSVSRSSLATFQQESLSRTQKHLLTIAQAAAARLEVFIQDIGKETRLIAQHPSVVQAAKEGLSAQDLLVRNGYSLEIRTFEDQFDGVSSLCRLDAQGMVQSRLPLEPGKIGADCSRQPCVSRILDHYKRRRPDRPTGVERDSDHTACASEVFTTESGKRAISICAPMLDNDQLVGIIRALVYMETINAQIVDIRAGKHGYAQVLDDDGIMVAHPDHTQIGTDILAVRRKAFPRFDWSEMEALLARMGAGEAGVAVYHSAWWDEDELRIVKKLTGFAPIGIGDELWSLSVTMGYDDIAEPIASHERTLFIAAASMLLAMLVAGVGFYHVYKKKAALLLEIQANQRLRVEVAERERAQEQLRDSEMRIRALLDASPVCNKIIDLDSRLQYMSAAGVKQLKIPDVQAYYGCPYPPEIYPESMRTPLIKHLERAKAGETSRLECPVLDAEGGELWYHTTFAPVRDNEGRIQYVIGVSMDITERKQAEEALKISESKFRTLYDSTSDAVMLLDEEGFLDCNLATLKVFGCASREQFCGKHPSDLSPATQPCGTDSSALADRQIATALEKGTNRFEWIHKRADGTEFPAEVLLNVMTLGGRSILQAVVRDITDRKRAEEELRHTKAVADAANQAKSDFLANMSHEIRTPMTAILGFAENMLDPDQSESERLNCVHTIRRNGEYLIGLINDILDLSKVEAGKMTVERTACQPCRIIAEAASLMRVRADAKGLQFHIEYLGAIPETIQSDPTRLRQILINLVGNAIKFTEAGAVRLVTRFVERDHAPSLQFDVVDTGRGMTDEQAARLFQPFMQADNSTTRKFGGTGLGLTISKRFAELLGGDITIAATELGVGTTFRASVATGSLDGVKMLEDPVSATTVVDSTSAIARVAASDLSGLRILLAEDGPDNQRLISFVLKKAGADVTVEENGKLALDAALAARDEGKPFDCILMDMQMPVMDGYEATRQLRRKGYAAPIIAMTAHAMAGDRDKCLHAGCDDYATKPIDRKELITTIQARLHADAVA